MFKKKYFSVSAPLAKEILKMYWYVPVIAFVLLLFSGVLPIISYFGGTPDVEWYLLNCLENMNIFFIGVIICLPIVSGVLMMSFLHSQSKALMLHSQPMSKCRILNTYCLSGWIMSILPIISMALIYMIVMISVPLIGFGDIIKWVGISCASITFYYGITILMGTFTGTTLMNLLCVGVMIMAIPVLVLITVFYCEYFMQGYYSVPETLIDFAFNSSPMWNIIVAGEELTKTESVAYFMWGAVCIIGAHIVYKTRKLERVGMATLSKTFEEVMTALVVFIGAGIFGLIATAFEMPVALILLSILIGLAVCIVSVKIVVYKSIKIFNKGFVKSLIVCAVCVAIFVSVTVLDVTGFSKRVPEQKNVKSVEIEINTAYMNLYYGNASEEDFTYVDTLDDADSVKSVIELHQYIVDNQLYVDNSDFETEPITVECADGTQSQVRSECILFKYNLTSGSSIERYYEINLDEKSADILDRIVQSEEFRENNCISNRINFENISYVRLEKITWNEDKTQSEDFKFIDDKSIIKELCAAWDKDVITYGYTKNNKAESTTLQNMVDVQIIFTSEEENKSVSDSAKEERVSFEVTDIDKNTVEYLTKQGYGQWIKN